MRDQRQMNETEASLSRRPGRVSCNGWFGGSIRSESTIFQLDPAHSFRRSNIGHRLPAVKKSGASALAANPYNRCHARAVKRLLGPKRLCASALLLPSARPLRGGFPDEWAPGG